MITASYTHTSVPNVPYIRQINIVFPVLSLGVETASSVLFAVSLETVVVTSDNGHISRLGI